MKPIQFPEQIVIFAKDQPQYLPLPAHFAEGRVTTCWQLNWKERLKLLFGGVLWHQCLTFGTPLQPIKLSVDKLV